MTEEAGPSSSVPPEAAAGPSNGEAGPSNGAAADAGPSSKDTARDAAMDEELLKVWPWEQSTMLPSHPPGFRS